VNTSKPLLRLFRTLLFSLPYIANVTGIMVLLFFIYSVLGMNLFGQVKYADNLHASYGANFETFQSAMLLLFRMMTGESYNGVMHDASKGPSMFSDRTEGCNKNLTMTLATGKTAPWDNCGQPLVAPIYFLSFVLFSDFLLMNILVAVILNEFGEGEADEDQSENAVTDRDLQDYKAQWEAFDPEATGFILANNFVKLVASLHAPLGSKPVRKAGDGQETPPEMTQEQIDKNKRDAKKIAKLSNCPTCRMMDPAKAKSGGIFSMLCCKSTTVQVSDLKDCVAFHEVLASVTEAPHDKKIDDKEGDGGLDLAFMQGLPQFKDLLAKKNNMSTVKAANKGAKRNNFVKPDGARFTVEEAMAAEQMQARWRGCQIRSGMKIESASSSVASASVVKANSVI